MKIHEYQAKELMKARGIPVPEGRVATTPEEAAAAVRPLVEATGNKVVVVKSQIHAGGRGKGRFKEHPDLGGVTVVTDGLEGGLEAAEKRVRELAEKMLGSTLVTIQTGEEGKKVNQLYIEQGIDTAGERNTALRSTGASSRWWTSAASRARGPLRAPERTPRSNPRARASPAQTGPRSATSATAAAEARSSPTSPEANTVSTRPPRAVV